MNRMPLTFTSDQETSNFWGEACRAAEKPLRQHVRQLYHKTGCALTNENPSTSQTKRRLGEQGMEQTALVHHFFEILRVVEGYRFF